MATYYYPDYSNYYPDDQALGGTFDDILKQAKAAIGKTTASITGGATAKLTPVQKIQKIPKASSGFPMMPIMLVAGVGILALMLVRKKRK